MEWVLGAIIWMACVAFALWVNKRFHNFIGKEE